MLLFLERNFRMRENALSPSQQGKLMRVLEKMLVKKENKGLSWGN